LISFHPVVVRPTILAFSGGRERERSDRRARPTAMPGWTASEVLACSIPVRMQLDQGVYERTQRHAAR
jgi:hypothetical protein